MTLYRLDASIRTEGSVTRAVADSAEKSFLTAHPGQDVVRVDVAQDPVPAWAWTAAVGSGGVPADQLTPQQAQARDRATSTADQLLAADAYLFAVPLYNFGVSQHLKTWWDLLVTEPRFGPGTEPLLAGRPAVLVTARGGGYGEGTPRAGWDHATGWMTRVLRDVLELYVASDDVELTLADVNPAMESLRPAAAQLLDAGHSSASAHGLALARRLSAAA